MANQEQYEIIGSGVEAWNRWRVDNPESAVDLSGADLELANLKGADLKGANLEGANLQGADLEKADLGGATLYGASLKDANLRGAALRGGRLRRADLESAFLEGADLEEADLSKAQCPSIFLRGANLRRAVLDGADLKGADLEGCDCAGASMREAKMGDVNLTSADFEGASLDRANLRSADLRGASLKGASLKEAKLYSPTLEDTSFRGANLEGAHIYGASLSNTDFEGAVLDNAALDDKLQKYLLNIEGELEEEAGVESAVSVVLADRLSFSDVASVVADLEQLVAACVLSGDPGVAGDSAARWALGKLRRRDFQSWLRYQYLGRYDIMFSVARLGGFSLGRNAEITLSIKSHLPSGAMLQNALGVLGTLKGSTALLGTLCELIDRRRMENEPEGSSLAPKAASNPTLRAVLQTLEETEAGAARPDEPLAAVTGRARDKLRHLPGMTEAALDAIAPRVAAALLNPCIETVRPKES